MILTIFHRVSWIKKGVVLDMHWNMGSSGTKECNLNASNSLLGRNREENTDPGDAFFLSTIMGLN